MAADDDGEVFEITDFTTASEWERFISRVEEILHEWKLVSCNPKPAAPKDAYTTGVWEEKTKELAFADFQFSMTHIWLQHKEDDSEKSKERESIDEEDEENDIEVTPTVYMDLMSMENDFPSKAHCICRWYGLQDFVVLYPANNTEAIMTESKTKLLLSSASIALSDAGCMVPIFVQVQQKWRRMYHGSCALPGSSVEFGMVHLKRMPTQYGHLAGLLDMFKAKLGSVSDPRPPVSVAVRFLYVLYDWVNAPWSQPLPAHSSSQSRDGKQDFDGEVGCSGFDQLPFGALEDPVYALQLYCTWPSLSEDMIVENQVYSDLDPMQAPQWSVRIQMTDDPQCLLGEYLVSFLALCHRKETLDQLIGSLCPGTGDNEAADISNALQRLTEPSVPYHIPSLTSYVSHAQKQKDKGRDLPIQGELMDQIVQLLFPDATKSQGTDEKSEKSDTPDPSNQHPLQKELAKQLKSAPVGGLVHHLSVCLCVLNHNQGGLPAVAQMWQEFVLEMRYRWEHSYMIAGIEPGPPNLGSCMLQQKLQMLNCCIEHKKKREQLHKGYTGDIESPPSSPYRGPSTSQVSRSLSQEEVMTESEADIAMGNSQSEASGPRPKDKGSKEKSRDDRNIVSDNSSDEEFYECDDDEEDDDDNKSSYEKDVDTQADNLSASSSQAQSRRESETDNQSRGSISETQSRRESQVDNQSKGSASQSRRESQTYNHSRGSVSASQSRRESQADNQSRGSVSETQSRRESQADNQSELELDCDPANNSMTNSQTRESVSSLSMHSDSMFKESYSHKAEGRLAPFQDLKLINCDETMYIPVTQEPAPMTEDMLEEHAEVLAKLGTSAEGAELRARMQSACLLSDMESFKAANPGSVLEDFVRWYSPRDWVEEQVEDENGQIISQGHLSVRMQIPGNMWVEVWQTARPVPARRQKRLFDDTKEAEKVLHFLSALKPSDVVIHLLPMLTHAALLKVIENDDPNLPVLKHVLEQACSKASQVTRSPKQDVKKYEEITRMIMHAEVIIARNISLKSKFTEDLLDHAEAKDELSHFVAGILQNSEVEVRGGPMGPAGSVIYKMFQAAQRASYMLLDDEEHDKKVEEDNKSNTSVPSFPRPHAREYILRTIVPRPAPYSKQLPQRMFCSIEEDEFRLAGVFSSDTVFQ